MSNKKKNRLVIEDCGLSEDKKSFRLAFDVSDPGEYLVSVILYRQHIVGSPLKFIIPPSTVTNEVTNDSVFNPDAQKVTRYVEEKSKDASTGVETSKDVSGEVILNPPSIQTNDPGNAPKVENEEPVQKMKTNLMTAHVDCDGPGDNDRELLYVTAVEDTHQIEVPESNIRTNEEQRGKFEKSNANINPKSREEMNPNTELEIKPLISM